VKGEFGSGIAGVAAPQFGRHSLPRRTDRLSLVLLFFANSADVFAVKVF
jgi:hypothetical protein